MGNKLFFLIFLYLSVKTISAQRRLVGGTETTIEKCPFQLSLMKNNQHICGAVVINKSWALTAAQCVKGIAAKDITLRAGSTSHTSGGNIHKVSKLIIHPSFDSKSKDYDIAVIQVEKSFDLKTTKPVVLVSDGALIKPGSQATVFGWGVLTPGGTHLPDKIHQIIVPTIEQELCSLANDKKITNRMMCAGLTSGGKDICDGDFGGAMIYQNKLIGIASSTKDCGKPGSLGVYTSVASIRSWIKQTSGV